jgi:hypothetical protein
MDFYQHQLVAIKCVDENLQIIAFTHTDKSASDRRPG